MNVVTVILVNYNKYKITLDCVRSLLLMSYQDFNIVIVDNVSINDSVEQLKIGLANIGKSNSILTYSEEQRIFLDIPKNLSSKLFLIKIKKLKNQGFAYGCNIGLNFSIKFLDAKYLWILNNDTTVEKDSLTNLMYYVAKRSDKKVGIIGSRLTDEKGNYEVYGRYNRLFGTGFSINQYEYIKDDYKIDYLTGASILVKRECVEDIGFLAEDFYLYFEDLEWCLRAKRRGWILSTCIDSYVNHIGSATTGELNNGKVIYSTYIDYLSFRNRIKVAKSYFFLTLISIYVFLFPLFLKKMIEKKYKIAFLIFIQIFFPIIFFREHFFDRYFLENV